MIFLAWLRVSQDGRHNLHHGTKSGITKCFEEREKIITKISTKNAIVIELSAIIKANAKSLGSTFNGYAEEVYANDKKPA